MCTYTKYDEVVRTKYSTNYIAERLLREVLGRRHETKETIELAISSHIWSAGDPCCCLQRVVTLKSRTF